MSKISSLQATSANLVIAKTASTSTSETDVVTKTSTASPSVSTVTTVASVGHAALVATLKGKESASSVPPIITPGDNPIAAEPSSYYDGSSTQYVQDYFDRSVDRLNSIIDTNQSMTDKQVSDAFYSGQGLQQGYKENYTINTLTKDLSVAADATADLKQKAVLTTEISQISSVFKNHTLVIQNATNVTGLDFQGSRRYMGQGSGTPAGVTANTDSAPLYNANYLQQNSDGKQHYFVAVDQSFSGVYLTW